MLNEPWFWRDDGTTARIVSAALQPFAAAYQIGAKTRRVMAREESVSAPVICVGNVTTGGVGKTPFAIALSQLLERRGRKCFFSTRGYGGATAGPLEVELPKHSTAMIGDEAILLAKISRTWVSKKRAAGARAAANAGADIVIMDDGFQNPTIKKDFSILMIDGDTPFSNTNTLPAGPLREPIAAAMDRADAIVAVVKSPTSGIHAELVAQVKNRDVLRCWIEAAKTVEPQRVVAFAGIGNPRRFFDKLASLGFEIVTEYAFPDHHPFSEAELNQILKTASSHNVVVITTEKDFVRLPEKFQPGIVNLPVTMKIENPGGLADLIDAKIPIS